jgi:hypothetical protein
VRRGSYLRSRDASLRRAALCSLMFSRRNSNRSRAGRQDLSHMAVGDEPGRKVAVEQVRQSSTRTQAFFGGEASLFTGHRVAVHKWLVVSNAVS